MWKSENARGAMLMCAAMGAFACNDAAIKLASVDGSIYQSIFVRGVFATTILGSIAWITGALTPTQSRGDTGLIALRTLFELLATLAFLTALVHMPIANITAILQVLPLTVSIGAALIFNERLGWRRLTVIMIGFVGVALIIRPDPDGFDSYTLLALFAVACVTGRDLTVRKLSSKAPSVLVAFVAAAVITCAGGLITLVQGWQPIDMQQIALLAIAALFILIGYLSSVATMRHGQVSIVAPFRYTAMIWAIILGWVIWGETMDALSLLGLLIVVAAGVYTFWRTHYLKSRDSQRSAHSVE